MNILWLINVPLPEASHLMGENPVYFGGWLIKTAEMLSNQSNVNLSILYPSKRTTKLTSLKGKKITYYPFKQLRYNYKTESSENNYFVTLLNQIKPDIVHIHGTEFVHTLHMVNACIFKNIKHVISIQGLTSIIEKHMYANLPFKIVYGNTLRNIIRNDSIYNMRKTFKKRGSNEIEAIKKTKYIIGRTTWDRVCTNQINANGSYYFCNETLRETFYNYQWNLDKCEKYSIFLSQGQYSYKGLHYVLKALVLIKDRYPNTMLYIAGNNLIKSKNLFEILLMTQYGKYIKSLIKRNHLINNVVFLGPLNEDEMRDRYLKTHVFVCPSTIENSPNSLGEAMILGVPSVASFVGGIPDVLVDKEEGFLYQHDAPYMLANHVIRLFGDDPLAVKISKSARERARNIHNPDINLSRLLEIYKSIVSELFD